jgi:murein DD-endopeptidase MepM/ murein hydrolase activator NlpD
MKVNALKIDNKTIVIKGFNENADDNLLKTIDLDIKNIDTNVATSSFGTDIVPVTIDISLDEGFTQLDDNDNDITEYEVVSGDNLSSIAKQFNISVDTILWANDLNSKSSIKVGQKLVILPVSGISYKVKKGDTISALAEKFNVTKRDIVDFNQTDGDKLIIGEKIIIPGAKSGTNNTKNTGSVVVKTTKGSGNIGSLIRPVSGGIKTQGIHGNNGVDIGVPVGTSVYASAAGTVSLVRGGDAWNGGYGNYIVVKHANGVQTLYAHLSNISVNKGEAVNKGEIIGRSGNTGRSTGPHLHFEVRGARNPF